MVWFPKWTTTPIPGVSLSASGLLALADLSTVAQRTAITGGSSWLDSFLLAPGLHYQQAAEELARGGSADGNSGSSVIDAIEDQDGKPVRFRIKNAATALYIQRIARPGQTVTLDVGAAPPWSAPYRLRRSSSGMHATVWAENTAPDLGWVSHVLYLISPVLTVASIVFVILFRDWWTLASILALMLSRILNIWVIKQRTKRHQPPPPPPQTPPPPPPPPPPPRVPPPMSTTTTAATSTAVTPKPELTSLKNSPQLPRQRGPAFLTTVPPPTTTTNDNHLTEYTISLGDGSSSVRLRGTPSDLQAITADAWLRAKTHVEGYLEAAAKLLVYMVAAFSGNTTQAGAMVMMALLLSTAGLLALSNANATSLRMNGRVAGFIKGDGGKGEGVIEGSVLLLPRVHVGGGGGYGGEKGGGGSNTWPPPPPRTERRGGGGSGSGSDGEEGVGLGLGLDGAADRAEKGEIRHSGSLP